MNAFDSVVNKLKFIIQIRIAYFVLIMYGKKFCIVKTHLFGEAKIA